MNIGETLRGSLLNIFRKGSDVTFFRFRVCVEKSTFYKLV